ncbi:aldolase/citrate lyase family protein [Methylocystis parvus]|uniref:aldolase/citrate lyase family protein n=1 Tax=Methylocystis parvus TaxID=134 RepID=UPI003C781B75
MRSILILAADAPGMATQALTSGASTLLLRLGGDDAAEREAARAFAREFIEGTRERENAPRIFVQVAPAPGELIDADLAAVVARGIDGVFLEACDGRAHVQQLAAKLSVREAAAGLPAGSVKIVALAAQTPSAIFALGGYRGASGRLVGLAMDETSPPSGDVARGTARALLRLGAAAAGVAAIDLAPDLEGAALDAACAAARREGFAGFIARSVDQLGAIERAFAGA